MHIITTEQNFVSRMSFHVLSSPYVVSQHHNKSNQERDNDVVCGTTYSVYAYIVVCKSLKNFS